MGSVNASNVSEYGQLDGQRSVAQSCGFCSRRNSKATKPPKSPNGGTSARSKFAHNGPKAKETKRISNILRSSPLNANAGSFVPKSAAGIKAGTVVECRGVQAAAEVPSVIQTSKYRNLLSKTRASDLRCSEGSAASPHLGMENAPASRASADVRNLGQMWASTFKPSMSPAAVAADNLEKLRQTWSAICRDSAPCKPTTTQDDIEVERLASDMDVSEILAWSEDETNVCMRTRRGRRHYSAHQCEEPRRTQLRSYVMQDLSSEIDHAVAMLVHRLHVFNDRAIDKVSKRYVLGMTDCNRRARQDKVKCLIIASDLDAVSQSSALDERVREVLAFAYQNNIEVIFALDRQRLGRAVGKSMGISILGVLETRGAKDLYGQAVALAQAARTSWLARHESVGKLKS